MVNAHLEFELCKVADFFKMKLYPGKWEGIPTDPLSEQISLI